MIILEWLSHPVVQSGLAPFVAALITAVVFGYLRLSGLAVIAGFCTTIFLVADFDFESLSTVKKIILSGLVVAVIAPLLDLISNYYVHFIRYVIVAASSVVVIWVFWPVLQDKPLVEEIFYSIGITVYGAVLAFIMDRLAQMPARAGPAGLSLGIATGGCALLAASTLLGQLGFAVGMACSAYTAYLLFSGRLLSCGRTFTFPVTLLCGLIASDAIILAKLSWYSLPLFLIIPLVAHLPLPANWSMRWQVVSITAVTLTSGAIPVFLAWRSSGGIAL